MKVYLTMLPIYIFFILIKNIGKTILITLTILSYCFAGSFTDDVYVRSVIEEVEVPTGYVYVYHDANNTDGVSTIFLEEKVDINKGTITYESYGGLNIILWVLFAFLVIITIIILVDDGYELDDALKRTVVFFTRSTMNRDSIDYIVLDRFLLRTDDMNTTSQYNITRNIYNIGDVMRLPKYNTILLERKRKLKKLKIS